MPKAKPSQVVVHRIELQEKERDALEAYVAGQTVKNVVLPATLAVGVGVAGFIGYKAAKSAYNWGQDALDDLKDLGDDVMESVVGKKTYTNPKDGKTYTNPLAGIPVLGSLFGSGINIGIASRNQAVEKSEKQTQIREEAKQQGQTEEESWWSSLGFGLGGAGVY